MKYFLYILKSQVGDKCYTGISQNPQRRLEYHNTLEKGFTSRYRLWKIVFVKEYELKGEAMLIEKKIKSWKSKKMIEKIISGDIGL
jgi:putative endonuclease